MLCISVAYAVVRCLAVTFVYCVETATYSAVYGSFCGMRIGHHTHAFDGYQSKPHFQGP